MVIIGSGKSNYFLVIILKMVYCLEIIGDMFYGFKFNIFFINGGIEGL